MDKDKPTIMETFNKNMKEEHITTEEILKMEEPEKSPEDKEEEELVKQFFDEDEDITEVNFD